MDDEPVLAELAKQVEIYKPLLIAAAKADAEWVCTHCGGPISQPEDGWLPADELHRQANRGHGAKGPIQMIALCGLIDQGVFELNNHLRVRLTGGGGV